MNLPATHRGWLPSTRVVVATVLSVVLPGSGSFYLGRLGTAWTALGLVTLGSLAVAGLWRLGALPAAAVVVLIGLLTLLAHAGGALLAAREAWQGRTKRAFLPSLGFMFLAALGMLTLQDANRRWIMASYAIATIAMEPSLEHGDRVLVEPRAAGASFRRGEIVALHDAEANENFVRRLIGLPGDRVRIDESEVFVNGRSLRVGPCDEGPTGCYLEQSADGLRYPTVDRIDDGAVKLEVQVPEGSIFVMRDRRDLSIPLDPLPRSWLTGVVLDVWWSYTHAGVDLSRLGLSVQPEAVP